MKMSRVMMKKYGNTNQRKASLEAIRLAHVNQPPKWWELPSKIKELPEPEWDEIDEILETKYKR